MSEMAITADHLIVIGRGRIITTGSVREVIDRTSGTTVSVRSPQSGALAQALVAKGGEIVSSDGDLLSVRGLEAAAVGETAAANGVVLHELTPTQASLEDTFMTLTAGDVEFQTTTSQSGVSA